MANKNIIINSEDSLKSKVYGLIRCIAHEMEADAAKYLKVYGLSSTQFCILDAIENCGKTVLTVNEIKKCMLDDSPNVSRSLNKLMERKLIVKERDLMDQRVVKIRTTKEGRQIHMEANMAITNEKEKVNLKDKDLNKLYELLLNL